MRARARVLNPGEYLDVLLLTKTQDEERGGQNMDHFLFLKHRCYNLDFFVYLGFAGLEDGVDKFNDSVNVIKDAFDVLVDDGKNLEENYDTMVVNCENSPACCGYTNIEAYLGEVDESIDSFNVDADLAVDLSDVALDYMESFTGFIPLFTLTIFFFGFISLFFYILFGVKKSSGGLKCANCCGSVTFVIVMILGAIFMFLTALSGDVCYEDPTLTILEQFPAGSEQDIMAWYSTCGATGENPLFDYTDSMTEYTNLILDEIESTQTIYPECNVEPQFLAIEAAAYDALDNIDKTVEDAACDDIQDAWFNTVNDGICDSFFYGFRACWVVALISTLLIFLLHVPTSTLSNGDFTSSDLLASEKASDVVPASAPPEGAEVMMSPLGQQEKVVQGKPGAEYDGY